MEQDSDARSRKPKTGDQIRSQIERMREEPESYAKSSARLIYQLNKMESRPRKART